jgi:hypothetical protein
MKNPSDAPHYDLPVDSVLLETIEFALAPYARSYPPEVVEQLRSEALLLLTCHPVASALAEQLRPAKVLQESGAVPTEEGAAEATSGALGEARSRRGGNR